jgi:hypothetical protein
VLIIATTDQATQNQSMEINAAEFIIESHRLIEEASVAQWLQKSGQVLSS